MKPIGIIIWTEKLENLLDFYEFIFNTKLPGGGAPSRGVKTALRGHADGDGREGDFPEETNKGAEQGHRRGGVQKGET